MLRADARGSAEWDGHRRGRHRSTRASHPPASHAPRRHGLRARIPHRVVVMHPLPGFPVPRQTRVRMGRQGELNRADVDGARSFLSRAHRAAPAADERVPVLHDHGAHVRRRVGTPRVRSVGHANRGKVQGVGVRTAGHRRERDGDGRGRDEAEQKARIL